MPEKQPMGFNETIAWYDANADTYSEHIDDFPSHDLLDRFTKEVGQGGNVIDAGCGPGRDTQLLHERGLHVTGLDITPGLLKVAQERHPELTFVEGNFLNLPNKNNTLDGIWAHASLLHLETIRQVKRALKEFHRTLKPNGVLHIFVKQQIGNEKTSVVSDKVSSHDRFFRWFTGEEIRTMLEEVGFVLNELQDNYPDPCGRNEIKWVWALARKK